MSDGILVLLRYLLYRLFWVVLKAWWTNWRVALTIVQLETVLGWQRAGIRMFWPSKSRRSLCKNSNSGAFKRPPGDSCNRLPGKELVLQPPP